MEDPIRNAYPIVVDGVSYDPVFPDVIEYYAQMSSAPLVVSLETFAWHCLRMERGTLRGRDRATVDDSECAATDRVPAGWLIHPDELQSFEWADGEDAFHLAAHRGCRFMLLRVPACQVHLFRSAGIESPAGRAGEAQASTS